MPMKFCLGCKKLTTNGSRCPTCQTELNQAIDANRGNRHQRGLGYQHTKAAKEIVQAAQVCTRCGQPPTPGNPLTAHHTQARAKGGDHTTPMVAMCRRCNSQIGKNT